MTILSGLITPKNVKGDPLRFFNIHYFAKYQKNEGGLFEDNRPFYSGMVLYLMLEALDVFKMKY